MKSTDKMVGQSESVEHKDGTEGCTHTRQTQNHIVKKGTESDKWSLMIECVCVGWSLCSTWEIHQDRPHTLTLSLSHAQTYQKVHLPLSSVKATILYFSYLWQRNRPQLLRQAIKISYFLIILYTYFINMLISFPTIQCRGDSKFANIHRRSTRLLSFCAHFCLLENSFIQIWTSVFLMDIKSVALHIIYNHSQRRDSIIDSGINAPKPQRFSCYSCIYFSVLFRRELQRSETFILSGVRTGASCSHQ